MVTPNPTVIVPAEGCRLDGHGLTDVTVADAEGVGQVEACADCTLVYGSALKAGMAEASADVLVKWARLHTPKEIADLLVDLAIGLPPGDG